MIVFIGRDQVRRKPVSLFFSSGLKDAREPNRGVLLLYNIRVSFFLGSGGILFPDPVIF